MLEAAKNSGGGSAGTGGVQRGLGQHGGRMD